MVRTNARFAAAGLAVISLVAISHLTAQSTGNGDSAAGTSQQVADIPADQIRKIAGSVSPPLLVSKVEPRFSDEARAEKFMGTVVVAIIVDTNGVPQNVHVIRGVGHGLDEKALEAITQYRFRPAMENGKPVPVRVNIKVNFQIKDKSAAQ